MTFLNTRYHLTLLFIVTAYYAQAQTKHLLGVQIGYEASYSPGGEGLPVYSGLKANKVSHDGISFGFLYRFQIKRLYVQTSPQYLNIGYGFESPEEIRKKYSYFESADFSFHYLTIPLKVGYMIVNKGFRFGLDVGLSYNLKLKSSIHYIEQTNVNSTDETLNVESNASIVSAHIGTLIGADISTRYTFELHPHYAHPLNYSNSGIKINYFGMSLLFGYYLSRK